MQRCFRVENSHVPYTKGTFHIGIEWNRNRWSVFEPSAIMIFENIWRPSGVDITPRWRAGKHSLSLPLPALEFRQWRELGYPRPSEIDGRNFYPRKESNSWWKEKPYKKWRSTPKPGLEFHILKVTICEQQACNRVNVNVSIYLLIVGAIFLFSTKP